MKFLEYDLEEIIYTADRDVLFDRGLSIQGKLRRQVQIGNYGRIDLVESSRPYYHPYMKQFLKGEICVYELKKDAISVSAFLQAVKYLRGLIRYTIKHRPCFADTFNYRIVLIGRTIDSSSDLVYLTDIINQDLSEIPIDDYPRVSVDFYTYEYKVDGIYFNQQSEYCLINEGF